MKNKEQAFITAILIIVVIGLSFLYIVNTNENIKLKKDNKELENTMTALKNALEIEEELRQYTLDDKFNQDCRYRNYSFYIDDIEGTFCCKWVNENRICMDWLSVVSEIPITINPFNFISQNATILVESDMGFDDDIDITLKDTKYDECDVYNDVYKYSHENRIRIRCLDLFD